MIEARGGKDAYYVVFVGVGEKSPFNLIVTQKTMFTVADNEDELVGYCERARKKCFPSSKWKFSSYVYQKISQIEWIGRSNYDDLKVFDPAVD